ncbi:iron hydrogenase small subunit [Candidatus Woesearchaeota archaeon]|nr:iron hydrogenase small subunit [Candidatus Woesearchaeota archaeon]
MKTQNFIVTLNGKKVEGKSNETVLELCKRNNIDIPTLCEYERLEPIGACRLCVVEIEGARGLQTSCTTKLRQDMIIKTHTPRVIDARRTNLKLLLANHDLNCTICKRNLDCKLQKYSKDFLIEENEFDKGFRKNEPVDDSSVSIKRNNNKCILCERCVRVCNEIQTVYAIGLEKRGHQTHVVPPLEKDMANSTCVNCGQCVIACPVGALTEKTDIDEVVKVLNDGTKYLIAQTAPSIRATLGECFGMSAGTPVTKKMVAALRELGFQKVFDTDLAADITIIEEATEFIKRFTKKQNLPMITTCCPAWIKFAEQFFPEQLNHMSSCRSPQAIMASLVKTYFAKLMKIKPEDIVLVDIMPCTAKKFEIKRPEFAGEADFVLTTVELGKLIKQFNIDFVNLKDSDFDNPLGESTGAGVIFGHTGGVMEAALRTAADWISNKNLKEIDYHKIRGMDTLKEAEVTIGKNTIKIACVQTLGQARKIMDDIKANKSPYDFIEIMACLGGCIGGGGQPHPSDFEQLKLRTKAIIKEDEGKVIRKSHKNKTALKIYTDYIGEFGGKKAHQLLHTEYTPRKPY